MILALIVAGVLAVLGLAALGRGMWIDRQCRARVNPTENDVYAPVVPIIVGLALLALALIVAVGSYLVN